MARKQYWGLTVSNEIKEGILVSMQLDGKFVISKRKDGKVIEIHIFNPGLIFDVTEEKSIPKKFKRYVSNYTDERVNITTEVKAYLLKREQRYKK